MIQGNIEKGKKTGNATLENRDKDIQQMQYQRQQQKCLMGLEKRENFCNCLRHRESQQQNQQK